MPVILLYNFEAAIFRSTGDTKTPLVVLTVAGILNVLLNLFFVAVLHMTVNGVAIATVVSNAVSSILLLRRLIKTDEWTHVELKELRIDKTILQQITRIGLPAGIQSAVFASSAAFNIEVFAYDVLNSFSQACTTFVGQNYGAGGTHNTGNMRCASIVDCMCFSKIPHIYRNIDCISNQPLRDRDINLYCLAAL